MIKSFEAAFMGPGGERRLERELVASLGEAFRGSGDSKGSFIWVCPDFEDIKKSLPLEYARRLNGKNLDEAQKCSREISRAYETFFRQMDVSNLEWNQT